MTNWLELAHLVDNDELANCGFARAYTRGACVTACVGCLIMLMIIAIGVVLFMWWFSSGWPEFGWV